ncbi:DNA-processing protein DprA [candidate division WOR-3 bacterium]|nr:DNA-processing protein DprA [candidate division WOR-3 bacterium]
MNINNQTQAVLLLTTHLGKPTKSEPKPLSPTEWGRLAHWLKDHEVLPETLLRQDPADVLAAWADRTITPERIRHLLGRAGALGLASEKWARAGLWVLTRADPDYPARLKKRLKTDSPPVLFGCGRRNLLNLGGIAIIGSRHPSEQDLAFTARLGGEVAQQGLSVVSGGARGVDEAAVSGALERGGTAVSVLSDSLLRAATSARYRRALMAKDLVLVSPFNPDAGFDVGNAMARNKYIYCLADAAIVIAANRERGGTWNGAVENLKKGWVPLWVKPHQDPASGNSELARRGAQWLPAGELKIPTLLGRDHTELVDEPDKGLPYVLAADSSVSDGSAEYRAGSGSIDSPVAGQDVPDSQRGYALFLNRLKQLAAEAPVTQKQLLESGDFSRSQLSDWLKRAVRDGHVRRLSNPRRYQWEAQLFDDANPAGGATA